MLFDLTFPCYLTTFSGKECLSGKVICVFFPAYRSSPVSFCPEYSLISLSGTKRQLNSPAQSKIPLTNRDFYADRVEKAEERVPLNQVGFLKIMDSFSYRGVVFIDWVDS
jgi:hypothetical protein